MRFLPTRVHGYIDYAWGVALLLAPVVLGFANERGALWTAIAFGLGAIAYSLVTNYELGLLKLVPMPWHLALDAAAGLALALSPFVLGLGGRAAWTFALFGGFAIVASLVTRTQPTRPLALAKR